MADMYARIAEADETTQRRLAEILELRAADAQQKEMRARYLDDLQLPDGARVVEIGCGTGAVTRAIADRPGVREVVGVDPSPVFVEQARALAGSCSTVSFLAGDGRDLPLPDSAFDAVVCHTSLCHIPAPERVLAEAARVAGPNGSLAVFDGDYATTTVAISDHDPLQACADAAMAALVHDRYLVRRLPALLRATGWRSARLRSHGYAETTDPGYLLTIVDRGADALVADGRLGADAARALKDEARRRAAAGEFFGHIAYASVIATR